MYTEIKPTKVISIESADEAWSVMYEYGLKKSLGGILEYFMIHRDSDDFEGFCHSLDGEHLKEALDYFLENFNQEKFLMFFESLTSEQQSVLLSLLLSDVCQSKSKEVAYCSKIIQLRKRLSGWKNELRTPKNVQNAIKSAEDNSFENAIHFLWKNPQEIPTFVRQLSGKENAIILGGLTLELMNFLPYKTEVQDEEVSIAA